MGWLCCIGSDRGIKSISMLNHKFSCSIGKNRKKKNIKEAWGKKRNNGQALFAGRGAA